MIRTYDFVELVLISGAIIALLIPDLKERIGFLVVWFIFGAGALSAYRIFESVQTWLGE